MLQIIDSWIGLAGWDICFNQSEALPRSGKWHVIRTEFLRSFLRRHFAGKPVVALRNVGLFLRLLFNRCRYRRLCRLKPGPYLRRKTQVLATPLGLSRDFWGFSKQSEVRRYCRGIPAANTNIQLFSNFLFRVISFTAFWKFFRARKFVMVFWGFKFWSRDFSRFCWKPLGFFGGFDFCNRSIIHVTWNPEYPLQLGFDGTAHVYVYITSMIMIMIMMELGFTPSLMPIIVL